MSIANAGEVPPGIRIQALTAGLEHRVAEAIDGTQRRTPANEICVWAREVEDCLLAVETGGVAHDAFSAYSREQSGGGLV